MCGIVGFMGRATRSKLDAFHNMLLWDQVRGDHSTGAVGIRKEGINIVKAALLPNDLMLTRQYDLNIDTIQNYCVIGHNRYATHGTIKNENAHPFRHGAITLVHNGTIWNKHALPEGNTFDTDSEAITYAIAMEGIEKVWKTINGAAVLVWWNDRDDTLNMITNGDRPIYFSFDEADSTVFFSSEMMMHIHAMERNGVGLSKTSRAMFPEKHYLYQFFFLDKERKEVSFVKTKLEHFVPPPVRSTYHNQTGDGSKGSYEYHDHTGRHIKVSWSYNDKGEYVRDREIILDDIDEEEDVLGLPSRYTNAAEQQGAIANKLASEQKVLRFPSEQSVDASREEPEAESCPIRSQVSDVYSRDDIRQKDMPEEEFHQHYGECCFCAESLEHEYESCVVLDQENAVCDSCVQTADYWGQSLQK